MGRGEGGRRRSGRSREKREGGRIKMDEVIGKDVIGGGKILSKVGVKERGDT